MDKNTLIQKAGSQVALAQLLNISQAAVCQWKTIPELRLLQLKSLKPEWFDVQSTDVSDAVAKTA